jgi:hypothetical protein
MQNVAILRPTSIDEVYSRQEHQARGAPERRRHAAPTEGRGGGRDQNRALKRRACLSRLKDAQLLPIPHAHFTQRPDTGTGARGTPTTFVDESNNRT